MAELKFRIYLEEDDAIYRDVVVLHTHTFQDLNDVILKAYEFDSKHQSTFFRSNDHWQEGREISKEKYDRDYRAEPLIMSETVIGSEIRDTNQKFIFLYDFEKNWRFLVELIKVTKEVNNTIIYPAVARTEGIGPQQYGSKNLLGDHFMDIEEKYDLGQSDGFGEEGEESETGMESEDSGEGNDDF